MRIIQIIETAMKHNELLVKVIKGDIWFQDKSVKQEIKDKQIKRYQKLVNELCKTCSVLEKNGITFNPCEAIEVIEIHKELKRKDIEIWLENWRDFNKRQVI